MLKLLLAFLAMVVISVLPMAEAKTFTWSGIDWTTRVDNGGPYGPGPNYFRDDAITVDSQNRLHLSVWQDKATGRWICSELQTVNRYGFGEFKWDIIGVLIDGKMKGIQYLDENVVLGLFHYPTPDVGPDGTNEMDIELSRWGNTPQAYPYFMNWSTYSVALASATNNLAGQKWRGGVYPDGFKSNNPQTHTYYRTKSSINFRAVDSYTGKALASQTDAGLLPQLISQVPMPVHINLWLNGSIPPTSGSRVEVVIQKFSYTVLR